MTTRDQVAEIIDAGDLGALGEEGEPIGDCLTKMWRAWSAPDRDLEIPDYLGEQLEGALAEQNAAYDDNGYTIDAPRAHDAKWLVCGVLDDITAAIYTAVNSVREQSAADPDLLQRTLAELNDRYTGLPDDYRRWVRQADTETLQIIYNLAVDDAPGRKITELLGYAEDDL